MLRKKKTEKLNQYFIALIPPVPTYNEALGLKQYFKENYRSKASLNSPPHITLHMPFKWKEEKEQKLISALEKFIKTFDAFMVQLQNYSSFPPKVIFINVVKSEELEIFQKNLQRFCKKELNLFNADYKEQPFHPHLTLAFRDLKKPNFQQAWNEFERKKYKAEFLAEKISLLKHNGKEWEVHYEFPLMHTQPVSP